MNNPAMMKMLFGGMGYIVIFIVQIALCIFLSVRIHKMQPTTAKLLYLFYTMLTGVSFAALFMLFKVSSILFVLLVTSILFGVFAIIGKTTKMDLSKFGTYLFIALIGVILLEIINIFLMNNTLNMAACIISLIIFLGFTAWDMQQIKYMSESGSDSDNMAILGAFSLYLDFINIFRDLLELFGDFKD